MANTMIRVGNSTVETTKTDTGYRMTVRDYSGVVLSSTLFTEVEWLALRQGIVDARTS